MKVSFPCSECGDEDESAREEVLVELRNDSYYDLTCSKGHKTKAQLRLLKFELLFDLGAMALLDGYTREAVASLAAALERFYEFYVEVIRLKHGISDEEFDKVWKFMSKQSERQLGAFAFTYLLENKSLPAYFEGFFNKKKVGKKELQKFRNDVTHAGYIPTHEEVVEYGEHVLAFIFGVLKELKDTNNEFIGRAIEKYAFAPFGGSARPGVRVQVAWPSIINLSMPFPRRVTISSKMEEAAGIKYRYEEPFGSISFQEGLEYVSRQRGDKYYK
jgi:hypothetical protein